MHRSQPNFLEHVLVLAQLRTVEDLDLPQITQLLVGAALKFVGRLPLQRVRRGGDAEDDLLLRRCRASPCDCQRDQRAQVHRFHFILPE